MMRCVSLCASEPRRGARRSIALLAGAWSALFLLWSWAPGSESTCRIGHAQAATENPRVRAYPADMRRESSSGGSTRVTRSSTGEAQNLFQEIMRLVRLNFAGDFEEGRLLADTLTDLTMASLPHCAEATETFEAASGPSQAGFVQAVKALAECLGTNGDRLLFRAVNMLLRRLDSYSSLLDDGMMKELTVGVSGKFGGIGLVVGRRDGDYVVVSAIEGSPAFQAGLKPGDVVLEIDGQSIKGTPLPEVLEKVRGKGGSRITLSITHRGLDTPRRVVLRRKMMTVPPVKRMLVADGIGYVRIVNFQTNTARELQKALAFLTNASGGELRGLVLDLRGNPGGLLEQAVHAADLFVHDEVITAVRAKDETLNRVFRGSARGPMVACPIVVLIDRGTASAAEVLAGALRGLPHVVLMGETSFGKASVQGVFPLSGGIGLRLTTAHYLTSDGKDIDGAGIRPDVAVSTPSADPSETSAVAVTSGVNPSEDPIVSRAVESFLSENGRRFVFSTLF